MLTVRRLVFAALAGGTVVAGLGAYLWYSEPPRDTAPHPFNRDRNAAWLQHRWLERPHTDEEMTTLLRGLSRRGVGYVYPHLIPFDREGRLPPHDREQMRRFLATARRAAPGLKVLPWVGGLRLGRRRTLPGQLQLADLVQRQRIVAECRGLVDEGFDGIHVNIEPVDNGNVAFLALLRALRAAVGPERLLSVSATRPASFELPGAPNFFWTPDYYARIADLADQVVMMAYDTALPRPGLYQRYVAYATALVTRRLSRRPAGRVLIGVPTYDATGMMHRKGVEEIDNALLGVIAGLRRVRDPQPFEGVALYAAWTTDEAEWTAYETLWRGRRATPYLTPIESAN